MPVPSKYPMPGNGDPIPASGLVAPTAGWAAVVAPTQASTAVPMVAGACTKLVAVLAVRALPEAEAEVAYIRWSLDSTPRAFGMARSEPPASRTSRPPWKPMPRGRPRQHDNVPALDDLPGETRRPRPRGMGVPHSATPKHPALVRGELRRIPLLGPPSRSPDKGCARPRRPSQRKSDRWKCTGRGSWTYRAGRSRRAAS